MFIGKEVYALDLEAVPPYSFRLTVQKPAGWWWATPTEIFEDDTFWTAMRFKDKLIGLKLKGLGTVREPKIRCVVFAEGEISDAMKNKISSRIIRALRIKENLDQFYALGRKDALLKDVIDDLYGMRTQGWVDLFPALILAVTLQMAPLARSEQMMDLLIENFGDKLSFDGKTMAYWPSPKTLVATPIEELKVKAKLGYRARNLYSIARTLTMDFPTMAHLEKMPYEEARKRLLSLRGIGSYSAEVVVPGMGFPLDVWSAKIFHILFLGEEPENPRKVISDLKEIAWERWGKWRGYAFAYILNDLPQLSKRVGVDLTQL